MIAQRPYDETGTPFPTTLWLSCRVLVRAVGELEYAGGVALLERELAERPGLRQSRRRADARVAALRAELAPAGPRRDGGAALRTSSRAAPRARRSSACTPMPPLPSQRPPTPSAGSCSSAPVPRRPGGLLRVGVSELSVRLAREDWRDGGALGRARAGRSRACADRHRVLLELQRELRRRLGQTYTLAALVAVYGDADRWARSAAQRVAPERRPGPSDGIFADPAFARAARAARDWTPG